MDIRKLTDGISVCGQISTEDVAFAAAVGFRSVICARPDGERPDQPEFKAIADNAAKLGLHAYHLPVNAKSIADDQADAFKTLLQELPGPVLAYCGTGWRAAALWALSQRDTCCAVEAKERCASAGFDLKSVGARLTGAIK